jgi:translation initiation factor 3 subunit C
LACSLLTHIALVRATDVDKLMRAHDRAITTIAKEGLPRFFVRALVNLEDAVNAVSKADTKTMSQANAKAYTRVKQGLKKQTEKFAAQMTAYRESPDKPDEAGDAAAAKGAKAARKAAGGDDSSDDEVVIGRECAPWAGV